MTIGGFMRLRDRIYLWWHGYCPRHLTKLTGSRRTRDVCWECVRERDERKHRSTIERIAEIKRRSSKNNP